MNIVILSAVKILPKIIVIRFKAVCSKNSWRILRSETRWLWKFIQKSSRIPLPSASLTNSDQRVWWIPKESAICALYLYLIASYSWCFSIGILPEKYTVGIPLSKAASFCQLCQIWIKNDAFATISRRNWEKHLKYLAKKWFAQFCEKVHRILIFYDFCKFT